MAVVNMPVECLIPHPQNPRKDLGNLEELTASIKENGIYQNLTVIPVNEAVPGEEPKYMVVIGHRRLKEFDALAKIKNMEARNEAMEKIGTNDFALAVKRAVEEEKLDAAIPVFLADMERLGIKKFPDNANKYSSKYRRIGNIDLYRYEETKEKIPKKMSSSVTPGSSSVCCTARSLLRTVSSPVPVFWLHI